MPTTGPHPTARRSGLAALLVIAITVSALTGCTSAPALGGGPSAPSAASSPAGASTASRVVIDIRLTGGTVSPNGARIDVSRGQTVVLNVVSDHTDEVHVHGFDIELPVTPNTPLRREFLADQPGSVEIESHQPEKIIAIMNVR